MFWRLFLSVNLFTSFVFVSEIKLNICNHDLSVAIRIIIVSVIVLIVDFMTETLKSVSGACKIDLDLCRNNLYLDNHVRNHCGFHCLGGWLFVFLNTLRSFIRLFSVHVNTNIGNIGNFVFQYICSYLLCLHNRSVMSVNLKLYISGFRRITFHYISFFLNGPAEMKLTTLAFLYCKKNLWKPLLGDFFT